jgi:hypothetical protein
MARASPGPAGNRADESRRPGARRSYLPRHAIAAGQQPLLGQGTSGLARTDRVMFLRPRACSSAGLARRPGRLLFGRGDGYGQGIATSGGGRGLTGRRAARPPNMPHPGAPAACAAGRAEPATSAARPMPVPRSMSCAALRGARSQELQRRDFRVREQPQQVPLVTCPTRPSPAWSSRSGSVLPASCTRARRNAPCALCAGTGEIRIAMRAA